MDRFQRGRFARRWNKSRLADWQRGLERIIFDRQATTQNNKNVKAIVASDEPRRANAPAIHHKLIAFDQSLPGTTFQRHGCLRLDRTHVKVNHVESLLDM